LNFPTKSAFRNEIRDLQQDIDDIARDNIFKTVRCYVLRLLLTDQRQTHFRTRFPLKFARSQRHLDRVCARFLSDIWASVECRLRTVRRESRDVVPVCELIMSDCGNENSRPEKGIVPIRTPVREAIDKCDCRSLEGGIFGWIRE
jgi:hypothetical protein